MPLAIVVDLDFVHDAPARWSAPGVGDVVSNLSAIEDWQLGNAERGEPIDGLACAMARTAAEAVIGRADSIESDAFLTVLAEALILSGMSMVGRRVVPSFAVAETMRSCMPWISFSPAPPITASSPGSARPSASSSARTRGGSTRSLTAYAGTSYRHPR